MAKPTTCIHCNAPVTTITVYSLGGTIWIHEDGYRECRSTYAAPNFRGWEK